MKHSTLFKGRKLLVATKHEKEKVIAPIFENELGVHCFVDHNLDTDLLGTFTGEVKRSDDPITTARKKCLAGMELTNCDMAVASEGSFGPHPTLFFAPADDEFIMFIDKKNDLEIIVRELTTETNFCGSEVSSEEELKMFATKANFPSHALILRKSIDDYGMIKKGITTWPDLLNAYHEIKSLNNKAYIETDMRAMHNPMRMKVIQKVAEKLVKKINSFCPKCEKPGFGITDVKPGLPCELCDFSTNSILSYIYQCQNCSHQIEEKYPNGKKTESPQYCDVCNP